MFSTNNTLRRRGAIGAGREDNLPRIGNADNAWILTQYWTDQMIETNLA